MSFRLYKVGIVFFLNFERSENFCKFFKYLSKFISLIWDV